MGLFSFIFAPGEAERSDRLDAQLRAHNQARVERGQMTPEEYATFEERLGTTNSSTYEDQLEGAFVEGWTEGLAREQALVKNTLSGTLKGIVGFVPWWGWILLVGFVLYQVGAWAYLQRRIRNA